MTTLNHVHPLFTPSNSGDLCLFEDSCAGPLTTSNPQKMLFLSGNADRHSSFLVMYSTTPTVKGPGPKCTTNLDTENEFPQVIHERRADNPEKTTRIQFESQHREPRLPKFKHVTFIELLDPYLHRNAV
uniref:Uncharacterized protein n=1 Tax=Talaromyces marneffei PM1 TaxID=1077442 RepID=A0A093V551_TALMA